ncbi:cupin domain-containing protein [Flavivirga amylovorans]|uniref:Cupin domain-containing protein n=1 Tax=Flavivirga amylovorans TaxID=870486 RepID=A0ABT8X7V9_9FLAO|nr:cupin domain-containing protein [Flavivirga amylovorans]MDO5989619.1 cupin domain-containing protein [Flavivirga amylovorans]
MSTIQDIVDQLELQPHPEGGYFKEVYRSNGLINEDNLGEDFSGQRNYATSIYFLLTSESFSAFHRIKQDEIWHFYKGSPIKLHIISNDGIYSNTIIGNNMEKGQHPQFVVKAKDWFAAEVIDKNAYALVGCTVSPGFDFKDFELPERDTLISKFPEHKNIITAFSRL